LIVFSAALQMQLNFKLFNMATESVLFLKVFASFAPTDVRTVPLELGDVPFSVTWDATTNALEWSSCVYVLVCHSIRQKPVITSCAKLTIWDNGTRPHVPLIDYATGEIKGAVSYLFSDVPSLVMTRELVLRRATQVAVDNDLVPEEDAAVIDADLQRKSKQHYSYDDLQEFVRDYASRLSWKIPAARFLVAEELMHLPMRSFTSLIGWSLPPHIYFRVSPAFYLDTNIFEDFLKHVHSFNIN
jgi:hypothetical protein